jgi:transcriptional regulator with XRE-family HTH domain
MKHASSPSGRRKAGIWLKTLREEAGLTQIDLAKRLGFKYYAFVSQVETGLSRVPTEKLERWAQAVGADPGEFTKRLISFYEPEIHRLLNTTENRRSPKGRLPRKQR